MKNRKKSMGANAVLSGMKTVLSVIFPLITFPYVSRVLSVENVGKYNFSVSVMSFVSLFAALGINTYAIRECSKYRNNREQLDRTASEIFTINVISTVIAYAVLFFLLRSVQALYPYRSVILILSINVLFTTIGCEWIYPIYENYLYITIRSLVTHLVSLILLFVMVKSSDDVIPYAIVTVLATSGGNLLYLFGRSKYSKIRLALSGRLKRHIKPVFTIFANTATTSIYVNSDVIILELMTTDRIVGLYSASVKIYTIVKNILAAVITVSVPRLSLYWEMEDKERFHHICQKVFLVLLVIAAPAMTGLLSLSKYVILLLSHSSYIEATLSLQILSAALLFSVFAWFYKSSILIPTNNEDKILRATLAASIANILLNLLLIPHFQQNAAAFTTLLAEGICLGVVYYYGKNIYTVRVKIRDWISVIIGCVLIFISCKGVSCIFESSIMIVCFSVLSSVIVYVSVLIVFKNTVIVYILKSISERFKTNTG